MSKYIRTKDGIYEVIHQDYGWEIPVFTNNDFGEQYIQEEDVVAQADTITELLDEIMFLYKGKRYKCIINTDVWGYRFVRFERVVHHVKKHPSTTVETINMKVATAFKNGIVYGSIWSGLDLKAVAKMNSKGELELL